jgi:hypothetical protein
VKAEDVKRLALRCSSCGVHYGQRVAGKTKPGLCRNCWALHLATQEKNIRVAYVARYEASGQIPEWSFEPPAIPTEEEP